MDQRPAGPRGNVLAGPLYEEKQCRSQVASHFSLYQHIPDLPENQQEASRAHMGDPCNLPRAAGVSLRQEGVRLSEATYQHQSTGNEKVDDVPEQG